MCPADPVHLCMVVPPAKKSRTAIPKAARPVRASRHSSNTATGHSAPAAQPCHTGPSTHGAIPDSYSTAKPWSRLQTLRVHKMFTASFSTSVSPFDISYTKFAKFAIRDCTDHSRETLISLHCILHLIQIINAPLHHFLSCFISFCY